jgi:hypothetical protein
MLPELTGKEVIQVTILLNKKKERQEWDSYDNALAFTMAQLHRPPPLPLTLPRHARARFGTLSCTT